MHRINTINTLICPAEDYAVRARVPDKPGTVAALQYALLVGHPYAMTSDDVLSAVAAQHSGVDPAGMAAFRAAFFRAGRPACAPRH